MTWLPVCFTDSAEEPDNNNKQSFHVDTTEILSGFSRRGPSSSLAVLSWNCCGLENPQTAQRLKDLNTKNSPDILFLQETKNTDEFVLKETETLNFDSHFLVPPHGQSAGGLALLWRKEINLQVLSSSQNHIDTSITYKGQKFHSTFVYGAPEIPNRRAVWEMLTNISEIRNGDPWFLTGDFNEITDNSEKSGGRERPESTFSLFRSFLSSCDLFDIRHTGNFLSWRGQRGSHLVHCRLDRAMANSGWSDKFPNGRAHYLPFEGSDHRPILSIFDSKLKKAQRLFRYDRRMRDNTEVKQLIDKVWRE